MARIFSSPRKSQLETTNDRTEELPAAENRSGAVRDQVDDHQGHRGPDDHQGHRGPAATTETEDGRATGRGRAAVRDPERPVETRPTEPRPTEPRPTEPRPTESRPAGPRARTSGMATIGLVLGVAAGLLVLTGTLAGYGIAVGVVGLFFSIGGISATGRRHVAGKSDAFLGLLLSLAAMVVGGLAMAGALTWLSPEIDKVGQVRDWLDANIANRF